MKITSYFLVCFMLLGLSITGLKAQPGKWENLGNRKVNYGLDHDEIVVTRAEGVFTAIKILVRGGAINMHKCVVHFGNGSSQEIELRHNFAPGSESRVIDLPGNKRIIKRISFWYDTKGLPPQKAVVSVFGKQ